LLQVQQAGDLDVPQLVLPTVLIWFRSGLFPGQSMTPQVLSFKQILHLFAVAAWCSVLKEGGGPGYLH
jgi:hypothetical protein